MNKKMKNGIFYIAISFVAVLAIGSVALAYYGGAPKYNAESGATIVVNEAAQPVVVSPEVVSGEVSIVELDENGDEVLGAVTGPVITSQFFTVGGVEFAFIEQTMRAATTTLCSIKNPFSATSTVQTIDYQITVGTSTASTIVASVSTGAFATSTVTNIVAAQTVASGVQDSMSATLGSTVSAGDITKSSYVLVKTEGSGLSGYTYTGKCQVVFRSMPR